MFLKDPLPINNEFFVWDAVVAWRDKIYQDDLYNHTKANYLTGMLKLIESDIVDVCFKLCQVDESWLEQSKQKIDDHPKWSAATKTIRKSCLNSFYNFIHKDFDFTVTLYRRHPELNEIKHILSSIQDKALTKDISPIKLFNALSKINERDAYIVWLMVHTGWTLDNILDVRNVKEDYEPPYMHHKGSGKHIPKHITDAIDEICKNSSIYLFETSAGKRVRRTQVTRNLKQAGYRIGLDFDLTAKVLHGYANAHLCEDKRSELEKCLDISID